MRKVTKKILVSVLAISMIAMLFMGCGNGNGAAGVTEEDFENPSGRVVVGGWPLGDDGLRAAEGLFNEQFPDVEVEYEFMGFDDFRQLLLTGFAAGTELPDVVMIEGGWIGEMRETQALVDLSQAPFDGRRLRDDFVQHRWVLGESSDGRLTAIPWDIGPATLFYRADFFEEAGLPSEPADVEAMFSTWDGFLEAAEAIHVPGERWMIANAADMLFWLFMNRDYYNERLELLIDRPLLLETIQAAITMRENGWDMNVSMWSNEAETAFNEGGLAAVVSGAWYGASLKTRLSPDNAGAWRLARVPGGLPDSNWGGSFVGIPQQSENKAAAWAYIEFVFHNPDAQNAMFEAVDYFPALLTAFDNDEVFGYNDPFFGGQQVRLLWADIARNTPVSHYTMIDGYTEGALQDAVGTALAQGLSADEFRDFMYDHIVNAVREQRLANIDVLRDNDLWDDAWD